MAEYTCAECEKKDLSGEGWYTCESCKEYFCPDCVADHAKMRLGGGHSERAKERYLEEVEKARPDKKADLSDYKEQVCPRCKEEFMRII